MRDITVRNMRKALSLLIMAGSLIGTYAAGAYMASPSATPPVTTTTVEQQAPVTAMLNPTSTTRAPTTTTQITIPKLSEAELDALTELQAQKNQVDSSTSTTTWHDEWERENDIDQLRADLGARAEWQADNSDDIAGSAYCQQSPRNC